MSAKNPQGAWGPYGGTAPAFRPYAWAKVDAGAAILASSGNLTCSKGSTGVYLFTPTGTLLTEAQVLAQAISNQSVPLTFSYEYLDTGQHIKITSYLAGVEFDGDFAFLLWSTN